MQADFLDAHQRHLDDAESLFQAERYANADHLYGMAAECGLKRLMIAFKMKTRSSDGSPEKKEDRQHADIIWKRFETYRDGKDAEYLLANPSPFDDWKAEQRYAHQGDFNASRVEPHRKAAQDVHALIKRAEKDGRI
ncbi:SAM-dependent methyltransferase [Azospirillum griseum]|uniref:SAM-dependent methyltransferase n=1 Tax=Azospirillum griseum TaxID=2496639 RepID=A0A431VI51_9PROT|nr:SAM-dependent methyltransferase [Azospirillum griseum]